MPLLYDCNRLRNFKTSLTRHEMEQDSGDRIERGAICDIWTSVSQHAHYSVGHCSTLSRQMIWQAMRRVYKWWQHDGFFRQFCGAENLERWRKLYLSECWSLIQSSSFARKSVFEENYLIHHIPVESIYIIAFMVLITEYRPEFFPYRWVNGPSIFPHHYFHFTFFVLR